MSDSIYLMAPFLTSWSTCEEKMKMKIALIILNLLMTIMQMLMPANDCWSQLQFSVVMAANTRLTL